MRSLALMIGLATVLSVTPAAADDKVFRDGDEHPFCESPEPCADTDDFDIRRLTQGHGDDADNLRHGIRMARPWSTKSLGGRNGVTIYIDFNLDDEGATDRLLRIRVKRGELWAGIFTGRFGGKRVAGMVRVWRPGRRSVKVGFSRDLLGQGNDDYRWRSSWGMRYTGCAGSCNDDHAPDRGWYLHRL